MSKLNKKTQFTIEFVILITFMLIVFLGFFAIVSYRLIKMEEAEKQQAAENIASFVFNEITLAKSVNNGYERTFKIPKKINGGSYNIKVIDNRELVVNYLEYEHVLFLPENVEGNVATGLNKIKKINGVVYLESIAECNDKIDNDDDGKIDLEDTGCVDILDNDETNCGDGVCESEESCTFCTLDCGVCPLPAFLLMKSSSNAISFDNNGNVVLKGALEKNSNPQPTADDEFIFKDSSGNSVGVVNLITGNMVIKGELFQNQPTLAPSPSSNDFIVKSADGNVVSYIDESGNLYLKGALTENGNP